MALPALPDPIDAPQGTCPTVVGVVLECLLDPRPAHQHTRGLVAGQRDAYPTGIEFEGRGRGIVDGIASHHQRTLKALTDFRRRDQHLRNRDLASLKFATQRIPGSDVGIETGDIAWRERYPSTRCDPPNKHSLHHVRHRGDHLLVDVGPDPASGWYGQSDQGGTSGQQVENVIDPVPHWTGVAQREQSPPRGNGGAEGEGGIEGRDQGGRVRGKPIRAAQPYHRRGRDVTHQLEGRRFVHAIAGGLIGLGVDANQRAQLSRVPDEEEPISAVEERDGIGKRDLKGLIHDEQIDPQIGKVRQLAHRGDVDDGSRTVPEPNASRSTRVRQAEEVRRGTPVVTHPQAEHLMGIGGEQPPHQVEALLDSRAGDRHPQPDDAGRDRDLLHQGGFPCTGWGQDDHELVGRILTIADHERQDPGQGGVVTHGWRSRRATWRSEPETGSGGTGTAGGMPGRWDTDPPGFPAKMTVSNQSTTWFVGRARAARTPEVTRSSRRVPPGR